MLTGLADIAAEDGKTERADALRLAIEAEIDYIARHIADEHLRGSFLARARGWRIQGSERTV